MPPYIFNIFLEAFTGMINEASDKGGGGTSFGVRRKCVPVSHLLFDDDILLFSRVDDSTTFSVRNVLENFRKMSGKRINNTKS